MHSDGTTTPEFVDRLMYVATTTGVTCHVLGGPVDQTIRKPYACLQRSYYDARTGAFLYGLSEGVPTP
jgi:hypothetical protein